MRSSKYSTRCACALVAFCPSAGWQHSQKAHAGQGPGTPKRRASLQISMSRAADAAIGSVSDATSARTSDSAPPSSRALR